MRTLGCGWTQFNSKWGFFSDEKQHTIESLKGMLLNDIIPHELALKRLKQLPTQAAPPQTKMRVLKALGTADVDVLHLEQHSIFQVEHLLDKVRSDSVTRALQ